MQRHLQENLLDYPRQYISAQKHCNEIALLNDHQRLAEHPLRIKRKQLRRDSNLFTTPGLVAQPGLEAGTDVA